jgi:pimeloyl-ACP methyl ester carboxylesterase
MIAAALPLTMVTAIHAHVMLCLGHQVMQEQPEAVHAIMDGFLASVIKQMNDG